MNAKVAKRIRKEIFGDQSYRTQDYGVLKVPGFRGRISGQLVCRGLRERYKAAKRLYKEARREGRIPEWIFNIISIEGKKARERGAHARS